MSYQALARKYRPSNFHETVGQEHVLRALINALDNNRLHHAYLFTGTRGVGKTTIARIFAKCLNCDLGVTSKPCGECSSCTSISDGRFVDLIEVDAASRTKVEDTRELLENVQFAPTVGRYKVYIIDEVHMLSTSSFNALLKTLEEPPPHVKFLLATTDPQKLPVTVLSRCLQFSLKNMLPEAIFEHLTSVLGKESIAAEEGALWALARSADGSMRDALSLTDQAIAYGQGELRTDDVTQMLGTIDRGVVFDVIEALLSEDPATSISVCKQIATKSPNYSQLLADLASALHQVAILQVVPDYEPPSEYPLEKLQHYAQSFTAEDLQLYYQVAVTSRDELKLAPEARIGFEMAVLRMLAFKPQGVINIDAAPESPPKKTPAPAPETQGTGESAKTPKVDEPAAMSVESPAISSPKESASLVRNEAVTREVTSSESVTPTPDATNVVSLKKSEEQPPWANPETNLEVLGNTAVVPEQVESQESSAQNAEAPVQTPTDLSAESVDESISTDLSSAEQSEQPPMVVDFPTAARATDDAHQASATPVDREESTESPTSQTTSPTQESLEAKPVKAYQLASLTKANFPSFALQLKLLGPAGSALNQMSLNRVEGSTLYLDLDPAQAPIFKPREQDQLKSVFSKALGEEVSIDVTLTEPSENTASILSAKIDKRRREGAAQALQADPVVMELQSNFDATMIAHTVKSHLPEEFE